MNSGLDIRYLILVAKRRLGFFAVPALLVLTIGASIVMTLPAVYNSSARILVESQQIPDEFVKSTVTTLATERLQVIQQRVMTRENLLRLASKFGLFVNRRSLSKTDLVDLMRNRITFQMYDVGMGGGSRRDDRLTVVFAVGFDYEQPGGAMQVANELVTLVLQEDIRNRTSAATETTKFLDRESKRLGEELVAAEVGIAEFKLKNSDKLPEKLTFSMSLLDRNERSIADIDRELAGFEERRRLLELEASIRSTLGAGKAVSDESSPEQQLQALRAVYAQRSAIYAEAHPEMRMLRRNIAALEQAVEKAQVAAEKAQPINVEDPGLSVETRLIAQKIAATDRSITLIKAQRAALVSSVTKLREDISNSSDVGAALASLERKREGLQKTLDGMATKLSQAKLGERMEEDQQAERFEVIEAPILPQEPVRPKRLPLLFLVLGASLAAGGGVAFGAEFLDTTVRKGGDLTSKLNQPLLVVIPYIKTPAEIRNRRMRVILVAALAALAVILGLLALHFLYAPLDIVWLQGMNRIKALIP